MADAVVATDVVVVVAVVALAPAPAHVAVPAPAPALAVALASSHALSCLTISNHVNEAPAPNWFLAGALFFQLECETKSDT
ncbi:exported hypothetical protein [Brevibacillus sp. IT-7CA2]